MKITQVEASGTWRELKGIRSRTFGYVRVDVRERGEYFAIREWKEPEFTDSHGELKIRDPNQKPLLALLRSDAVLAQLGAVTCGQPVRLVFDRYAGCASCPCSPGFRPVDAEGRRGWLTERSLDLVVDVDDSYTGPPTVDPPAPWKAESLGGAASDMVAHLDRVEGAQG